MDSKRSRINLNHNPHKMMKNLLLLAVSLAISNTVLSQKNVEVSEDYSTVLIFEMPIEEAILGNEKNYKLLGEERSRDGISSRTLKLGYVTADNIIKNTNLTIITSNGYVYDIRLNYNKQPKLLTHFINSNEAIMHIDTGVLTEKNTITTYGNENEIVTSPVSYYSSGIITKNGGKILKKSTLSKTEKDSIRLMRVEKKCVEIGAIKKKIFNNNSKVSNMKLSLKEVSFNEDELYIHLALYNKGEQSYDVDLIESSFINFEKDSGTKGDTSIIPVYTYNKPTRVQGKSEAHFILVFEKFSINDKKQININIGEKEGARNLNLRIGEKIINNPVKL